MSLCAQVRKCRIVFLGFFAGALVVFCGPGCSKSSTGTMQDPEATHLNKVCDLAEEFKKMTVRISLACHSFSVGAVP